MANGLTFQELNIASGIAAAFVSLCVAFIAWRHRHSHRVLWFTSLAIAVCWIAICYVFEALAGYDLERYIFYSKIEYIPLAFIPLLWLGFALTFSGKERPLSPALFALFVLLAFVTIALVFTNEAHGLIWKEVRFDAGRSLPIFTPTYGMGFWVYIIYAYLLYLVGSVVLFRQVVGVWNLYRAQAVLVLIGTAMPWIGNLLQIFDSLNPVPELYLNAFFLTLAMTAFAFGLFRLHLFDIMPLAHETVLNTVPAGLVVIDAQGHVVAVNKNAQPYLAPGADPIGKPVSALFAFLPVPFHKAYDVIAVPSQNEDRYIEVSATPIIDRRGTQRGHLLVLSDITERKQAELELRQALEKEKELHQLKSRFVSMVSHEFRTPLAAIQTSGDLLKYYWDRMSEERKREHLEKIEAQIRLLTGMLEDILMISKAEVVGEDYRPERIDVEPLCRALVDELRTAFGAHQAIHVSVYGQARSVEADPKLLRQAVANLLSNAIKYSPEGSSIYLNLFYEPDQIRLQVRDNGIGIPKEDQKRLFDLFHRAENVGNRQGTGLGLAIVKRSVEAHGGTIQVQSEIGKGTVFTIAIPAPVEHEALA